MNLGAYNNLSIPKKKLKKNLKKKNNIQHRINNGGLNIGEILELPTRCHEHLSKCKIELSDP